MDIHTPCRHHHYRCRNHSPRRGPTHPANCPPVHSFPRTPVPQRRACWRAACILARDEQEPCIDWHGFQTRLAVLARRSFIQTRVVFLARAVAWSAKHTGDGRRGACGGGHQPGPNQPRRSQPRHANRRPALGNQGLAARRRGAVTGGTRSRADQQPCQARRCQHGRSRYPSRVICARFLLSGACVNDVLAGTYLPTCLSNPRPTPTHMGTSPQRRHLVVAGELLRAFRGAGCVPWARAALFAHPFLVLCIACAAWPCVGIRMSTARPMHTRPLNPATPCVYPCPLRVRLQPEHPRSGHAVGHRPNGQCL